jgi:hypothetical protein
MTFKKDGRDPITPRPNIVSMGGLTWVVNAAFETLGFDLAALLGRREALFYDGFRYRRSGRGKGPTNRKRRHNMLHVSKRVRRRHRRAKLAA